jgi:heptosyltransferase II
MATPAMTFLRAAFPNSRIDALARPGVADILADNPALSEVIQGDDRRPSAEILSRLRSAKYDAAALFPNSFGTARLISRLNVPRRIGFARNGRGLLLTDGLRYDPAEWQTPASQPISRKSIEGRRAIQPRHMVEYYLEIAERTAEALGRTDVSNLRQTDLRVWINAEANHRVDGLFENTGVTAGRAVGVNPGAAYGGAKRWPLAYLGLVVRRLADAGNQVVSTAGPRERVLNDELEHHAGTSIHRIGESVDVRGLVALIARLRLLITNDSGAMHIAAALNVPTVSIFGPTDWQVTRPLSPGSRVVRNSPPCAPCILRECPIDHRCMTTVTPDEVFAAAMDGLVEDGKSGD